MLLKSIILAAGLAAGFAAGAVAADDYPTEPITLVVTNAAGGGQDILARQLATPLSQELGKPIIILNKAGAGGTIGAAYAAAAKPDGYTLLLAAPSVLTIAPNTRTDLTFDTRKSFAPIGFIGETPYFLVVHPDVADSVKDLIAKAKAKPGELNYGAAGQGSLTQITPMLFAKAAGIDLHEIIYNGLAQVLPDLLADRVQISFGPDELLNQVRAGKLKALAVTTKMRSPSMPDLPTLDESGLPGFDLSSWYAVLAPAGTPPEIITKVNAAINAVISRDPFKSNAEKTGLQTQPGKPEDLAQRLDKELADMKALLGTPK